MWIWILGDNLLLFKVDFEESFIYLYDFNGCWFVDNEFVISYKNGYSNNYFYFK